MIRDLLDRLSGQHRVHGMSVRLLNTRPDIRNDRALERLGAALDLIAAHAPRRYRRLRTDFSGFVVQRFACRGAFFPDSRECLVELTFTVNPRPRYFTMVLALAGDSTMTSEPPRRVTGSGVAVAP